MAAAGCGECSVGSTLVRYRARKGAYAGSNPVLWETKARRRKTLLSPNTSRRRWSEAECVPGLTLAIVKESDRRCPTVHDECRWDYTF